MRSRRWSALFLCPALLAASAASAVPLTPVPNAYAKVPGFSAASELSPELIQSKVAQGAERLENPASVSLPDGGTTVELSFYGYDGNGPFLPTPGDLPNATHLVEATKTEPDKNTYLELRGQRGADEHYDYGKRFLFQGHEGGAGGVGYITRVNLDAADPEHRITLFASTDASGGSLPVFDGSTWDPFARRLLFSAERGSSGAIYQSTLAFPPTVENLFGSFGRGGFEGIQNDSEGNVWVVEDVGGPTGTVNTFARQPNSFVYRFVPYRAGNLTRGRMQALQVISRRTGEPIVFHAGAADADILSDDVKDLHTYGLVFRTRWVTVHDTRKDGTDSFDANALAKAAGATPFKRPENGQFRPGDGFREFFFDATGDTNAQTQAGSTFGGFGAIFRLRQEWPGADEGHLRLFYRSDVYHSGFDNLAFWDRNHVVFVEDAGDTLHTQRNALDSAFLFDVRRDYAEASNQPLRILAEGRDPSATIDSGFSGLTGFQNDGDNEITGIHISDGDPGEFGILGARVPRPFRNGWRVFYTQQHGDNYTWEIHPANPERWEDRDDDDE